MREIINIHPTSELIESYSMQRVSGPQETYVEEHLLICHSCRRDLEHMESEINLMKVVLM